MSSDQISTYTVESQFKVGSHNMKSKLSSYPCEDTCENSCMFPNLKQQLVQNIWTKLLFAVKPAKTDNLGETAQAVPICLLQDHILLSFII